MLKSPLFWKMTTLFGAVLLLLIPIMLIRQVIVERADYRSDVEDAIRQSTSGPQKLVGPLIAIPVTELYTVQEEDKTVERKRSFIHFWLPESLMVDGNQNVEERKIGIYTGQVWHSDLTLKADFDVSRLSELNAPNITLGKDGVMWGLLNSADSALLLGTSVLVVALAGMMFVTRNIDWYAFSLPKMKASKEVTTDDELRIWK
ncbi:TPA: inner membrane CreD family protein [Escherichia coli]|nr:inner membrane CreD family protein [Escherichia coli]HCN4884939.1 inner membrane CreD family protein [Escherichia coli]HCN4967269.1 inner membrane CreD family protein [Escherichia coli]HCN5257059.1 inner membrane CreD family protein [Escherichia coli]HCN5294859.1 inner membrane CreD family protein [Escherichia coli]